MDGAENCRDEYSTQQKIAGAEDRRASGEDEGADDAMRGDADCIIRSSHWGSGICRARYPGPAPGLCGEGCCVNRCYQHCRGGKQLLLWSGRTGDRSMAAGSCDRCAPYRCKRDSVTPGDGAGLFDDPRGDGQANGLGRK
jgi:hypothetical protein